MPLSYWQSHHSQPQPSKIMATISPAMVRFSGLLGFMVSAASPVEFQQFLVLLRNLLLAGGEGKAVSLLSRTDGVLEAPSLGVRGCQGADKDPLFVTGELARPLGQGHRFRAIAKRGIRISSENPSQVIQRLRPVGLGFQRLVIAVDGSARFFPALVNKSQLVIGDGVGWLQFCGFEELSGRLVDPVLLQQHYTQHDACVGVLRPYFESHKELRDCLVWFALSDEDVPEVTARSV